MNRTATLLTLTAVCTTLGVTSGAGVANAATPAPSRSPKTTTTGFAAHQDACEAAVDGRLKALTGLQTGVAAAPTTTAAHTATLTSQIAAATAGLTTLGAKIAADTDATTLDADCTTIVPDYRVYVIVVPRTTLVIAADADLAATTGVTNLEPALRATIAAAKLAGKDTTAAQAAYTDLQTQVPAAQAAANPVAGEVIGLVPSDYPSSTTTLKGASGQVRTATKAMKQAAQDVQTISALAS